MTDVKDPTPQSEQEAQVGHIVFRPQQSMPHRDVRKTLESLKKFVPPTPDETLRRELGDAIARLSDETEEEHRWFLAWVQTHPNNRTYKALANSSGRDVTKFYKLAKKFRWQERADLHDQIKAEIDQVRAVQVDPGVYLADLTAGFFAKLHEDREYFIAKLCELEAKDLSIALERLQKIYNLATNRSTSNVAVNKRVTNTTDGSSSVSYERAAVGALSDEEMAVWRPLHMKVLAAISDSGGGNG